MGGVGSVTKVQKEPRLHLCFLTSEFHHHLTVSSSLLGLCPQTLTSPLCYKGVINPTGVPTQSLSLTPWSALRCFDPFKLAGITPTRQRNTPLHLLQLSLFLTPLFFRSDCCYCAISTIPPPPTTSTSPAFPKWLYAGLSPRTKIWTMQLFLGLVFTTAYSLDLSFSDLPGPSFILTFLFVTDSDGTTYFTATVSLWPVYSSSNRLGPKCFPSETGSRPFDHWEGKK